MHHPRFSVTAEFGPRDCKFLPTQFAQSPDHEFLPSVVPSLQQDPALEQKLTSGIFQDIDPGDPSLLAETEMYAKQKRLELDRSTHVVSLTGRPRDVAMFNHVDDLLLHRQDEEEDEVNKKNGPEHR